MGELVDLARVRERRASGERLLTKAEVAARCRVTERTIGRWMGAGLPYVKPFEGGAVRFRPVDVDDWLTRRRRVR